MSAAVPKIKIPMINSDEVVEFFPDELSDDANDLMDVLRSELAPFRVWKSCAIEYRRQGLDNIFDLVLNEIVVALEDPTVDKIYRERDDYAEGLTEIFVALAARTLCELSKLRASGTQLTAEDEDRFAKKIKENFEKAEDKLRLNEYTWLIKGFYVLMVNTDVKRAEELFRAVHDRATKGQNLLKKKYLFGSLLGLGMIAYARQNFALAFDHFSKAILSNPSCNAGVRLAVACCCFKLEQYDRAKSALDKALKLEPTNSNVIVTAALLELALAKQKGVKQPNNPHSNAVEVNNKISYDYCRMALAVDSSNAMALNTLANHYFHAWTSISFLDGCYLLDRQHILLPRKAAVDIRSGDKIMLNNDKKCLWSINGFIQDSSLLPFKDIIMRLCGGAVNSSTVPLDWSDFLVIQASLPSDSILSIPEGGLKVHTLNLKELNKVSELSKLALSFTKLSSLKAECYFTIGKVHHSKGELNEAFNCYLRALQESPELTLAAFGAAQIYFSRSKFADALELFEKVLAKSPDDKDTQAYVMLLKAMNKQIATPFEKLREIVPGFKFEIDSWLLQGQLKQKVPSEYPVALKCYLNAKECIEQQYGVDRVPSVLFLNISVLNYSLGKTEKAYEFARKALTIAASNTSSSTVIEHEVSYNSAIYSTAEFEGVFYEWSTNALCQLKPSLTAEGEVIEGTFELSNFDDSMDLTKHIKVFDEIIIGDIKHTVKQVNVSSIVCTSPIRLTSLVTAAALITSSYGLFVKRTFHNFSEDTVTYCYNYARILEDLGKTKAATDVYVELLKNHPSFIECYLRLSLISSDLGKLNDAQTWLNRALEVNNEQPDATICLGDLHVKRSQHSDALKCYDRICASSRHDARSMLSLGNYYFGGSTGKESRLKDSYKFFYHVLNEDSSNIYAANGLGMVCAEKGELDAAKDIFLKAREANKSHDISVNLANVHMTQSRIVDAERLYHSTYNNFLKSSSEAASVKTASLTENVAFAQAHQGRYEDAVHTLQKAIHMQPNDIKLWYNLAVASKLSAAALTKKVQKSSVEIEDAKHDLVLAVNVFELINRSLVHQGKLTKELSKVLKAETVQAQLHSCKEKFSILELQLESVLVDEAKKQENRAKQQHEHELRLKVKLEEKEVAEKALESEKREKQALAAQKQAKLAELQEKWVVATEVTQSAKKAAGGANSGATGGKRKRKGDKSGRENSDDEGIIGGNQDSDNDDNYIRSVKTKASSGSTVKPSVKEKKKVVYQTAAEGAVDFGSSSEEEDDNAGVSSNKAGKSQLDIDLFGSDDSDDEGGAASGKRKASREEGEGATTKKKRLTKGKASAEDGNDSDDFNEDGTETGFNETSGAMSNTASNRRTIDSDEE